MTELSPVVLMILVSGLLSYLFARRRCRHTISALETECKRLNIEITNTAKTAVEQYRLSEDFRATLELQFLNGKAIGAQAALDDYKSSEDFKNFRHVEYANGKQAGAAEELAKFHISYTPLLIDEKSFFSHKVDADYEMQLHYAGFPIGDPTCRITHHKQESKDENINKVLSIVANTLELAVEAATKQKIPITVAKTHKREPKK